MSLVVAYARDGVVYMGCDTQTTAGEVVFRTHGEKKQKIFHLSNGLLVGVVGQMKLNYVLQNAEFLRFDKDTDFNMEYIIEEVMPELANICETENMLKNKDSAYEMDGSVIMVWKGAIYHIRSDFTVFRCAAYAAIGSGREHALYALDKISDGDVNDGLIEALRCASAYVDSVSAPYMLINSRDLEYTQVEG